MKLLLYAILEALLIIAACICWCEIGYYYFIFYYSCSDWPDVTESSSSQNFTRIMVLADTHIMGYTSARIDKLRREWQMQQAFGISNKIYQPDLTIFLGDIFDEASFSPDNAFEQASNDFDRIFPQDSTKQQRVIIAGNHDVGFHNQFISYPYLMQRFHYRYRATPSIELIKLPKLNDINIIAINSMSFYNDTCPFCSQSIADANKLAKYLINQRKINPSEYSSPILLSHIPLFRPNDLQCDYPNSLKEVVKKTNIEGEDVLHSKASQFLLEMFQPRLILSGHTHMECPTTHKIPGKSQHFVEELTISSYNHKNAEKRPTFLLLSVNSTHFYIRHCNLIEEWIVISVYIATLVLICSRFIVLYKGRNVTEELKNKE